MLEMKETQLIRKKEKKQKEKVREREGGRGGGLGDVFLIFTERVFDLI
jgi:hypothetical protein